MDVVTEMDRRSEALARELLSARRPDDQLVGEEGLAQGGSSGIAWLVAQIDGLIAHGAPGIHLYILNQAKTILDPHLAECLARWRRSPDTGASA